MGVETESFAEAVRGSGNKLPILCSENHVPNSVTSLSSREEKREDGK